MTSYRQASALAALLAAAVAGCYSPSISDCSVACGPDSSCPDGTRCGSDNLCHTGATDVCTAPPDGRLPTADARTLPDGRTVPDAAPGVPDAPPRFPDAPICQGADVGEPDDTCPGEILDTIVAGSSVTIEGRTISPASDVDVYAVPLKLGSPNCQPGQTINYAMRIRLVTTQGSSDLRLGRGDMDLTCDQFKLSGTQFCIPFSTLCPPIDVLPRTFYFDVEKNGGNNQTCEPYTVTIDACGLGSTCDTCGVR